MVAQHEISQHMEVSWNGGTPKSSISSRMFLYKPSILGYPIYGNPYICLNFPKPVLNNNKVKGYISQNHMSFPIFPGICKTCWFWEPLGCAAEHFAEALTLKSLRCQVACWRFCHTGKVDRWAPMAIAIWNRHPVDFEQCLLGGSSHPVSRLYPWL